MESPKGGPEWAAIRTITDRLLERSDTVADELLAQQQRTVPGLTMSPPAEAREHARWLVRAFLRGIGERRTPTPRQISRCEEFGARRAGQGVEASAMMRGYHLAHRELWQLLIDDVVDRSDVPPALLAVMFVHGLKWLNSVIDAINRGFQAQDAQARTTRERAVDQFLTLLETADPTDDTIRSLATGLGYDPDGTFYAVHGHPPPGSDRAAGTRLVQADCVDDVLGPPTDGERWGIGATRPGLHGARRTVIDAKLAYAALADGGGRLDFAQAWCLCLPQAHREAIDPLVDDARQVAHARPHLLDAVVAFAGAGFSVTQAARALLLHPNTVSYRLDQWRRLTGLDPRTVNGLIQSLYLAR